MVFKDVAALLAAAEPLIELAIAEDIGPGDATSESTLPMDTILEGRIIAKEAGVIAGLPVAEAVFQAVARKLCPDPAKCWDIECSFVPYVTEGQDVVAGELVAEVKAPGPWLLAAERLALNFLQRMSGIATATRQFVDAVATTNTTILDTRKTLPGYRVLDKYAVRMGGGSNHRMSLFDMLMVKDNHIDGSGGLTLAVARAREHHPELPIEVEVRSLDELRAALAITPPLDRILLDNMAPDVMREAVAITAGRVPLEASGNVTLDTVAEIAATGVDYVSTGSITHSVPALDLSMKVGPAFAPAPDLAARIQRIKDTFGERLVILGHHYQRDSVIEFADYRGDSLQLSRIATQTDAEFIVFCGVHFMAEVAAILAKPGQHVLIPDPTAGCYLADTAMPSGVQAAWDVLAATFDDVEAQFMPITYVNSSAELKAFCGKHGGVVCTSGNASQVVKWALEQRPRVFFFPDQHLGRNTAHKMGFTDDEILLWDLLYPPTDAALQNTRVLLWPGACNVHQRFTVQHIKMVREQYPGIQVVVHPECKSTVVDMADDAGSTARIIKLVEAAPAGTRWAIGTESRLVYRLQKQHPEQVVVPLSDVPPYCVTMGQITVHNLAEILEALESGKLRHTVTVDADIARWARVALERMLELSK
ncbi:MAG: quinolinate synthase NadA [Anaerolineae bacterium]|nr:quinolinate synthase NadA [Anaerolineae bacterium]